MARKRKGDCVQCGECCKVFRVIGVASEIISQHGSMDEARAYYSFRGANIAAVDMKADRVAIEMNIQCSQLLEGNLCALHDKPEKKPLICHLYPTAPDDIPTCGYRFK